MTSCVIRVSTRLKKPKAMRKAPFKKVKASNYNVITTHSIMETHCCGIILLPGIKLHHRITLHLRITLHHAIADCHHRITLYQWYTLPHGITHHCKITGGACWMEDDYSIFSQFDKQLISSFLDIQVVQPDAKYTKVLKSYFGHSTFRPWVLLYFLGYYCNPYHNVCNNDQYNMTKACNQVWLSQILYVPMSNVAISKLLFHYISKWLYVFLHRMQWKIIDMVLNKHRDVCVVMATGEVSLSWQKSRGICCCYQCSAPYPLL